MPINITSTDNPAPEVIADLGKRLETFNELHSGHLNAFQQLAILVTDSDTEEVLGGLWGQTAMSYLHICLLYLPENLRGSSLGRTLVTAAEKEASQRGCRGVWLDTFSFQAPAFYERLGYAVVGTIEDFPPGHTRFFLTKSLPSA